MNDISGVSRLLFSAIMGSSESVVVTDARENDNPIIFVNPAFELLTGYANAEIVGRNCRFLQGKDRDQRARKRIKGAVIMGEDIRVVIRNYRKDGTSFMNELSISPVYDKQGRPRYFVGVQHQVQD